MPLGLLKNDAVGHYLTLLTELKGKKKIFLGGENFGEHIFLKGVKQ